MNRRQPSRRRRTLKLSALLVGVVVVLPQIMAPLLPDPVKGDLELVRSDRPGVRVLFVGNALVSQNSMIMMLRDLAEGDRGAPPVFAVHYAPRGSTLDEAVRDDELSSLLDDERWDYVVLQEHSQTVSRPGIREERMVPAATKLDALARHAGARTVLFAQGGYAHGDEENTEGDSYSAMHARVLEGYRALDARLDAVLAPIGYAWTEARRQRPDLDLWNRDGIRPSHEGSYLTACVLYALLSGRDPTNSRFTAELTAVGARTLQEIARRVVQRHDAARVPPI